MQNYKLTVEYEGTRYNGWQKQGNTGNTIQEKFENILEKLCGKKVEIHGSGRTDAGVHAMGQTANFKAEVSLSEEEITKYFNKYLPEDIAVVSTEKVDKRFHARLSAKKKTYVYRIWTGEIPDVFGRKFRYNFNGYLDLEIMKQGAKLLCGTHDFAAFCSNKRYKRSTVREIYYVDIEGGKEEIVIRFCGNGFLYNMVRIMVGTLIEIGQGKREPGSVTELFESKIRENAGFTAPPRGLTLERVEY